MARDLNEFLQKLTILEKELQKEGPRIASLVGAGHIALATRRIQKEGVPGKSYSTKLMFATQSQFNRKDRFKPTEVSTELGRDENGKLVKGGNRNKQGQVAAKGKKKRYLWIKFPKAKKAVPVMILEGGYKQLRQLNGLQTGKVDLTFSGRMLQNVKILRGVRKQDKFLSIIGIDNQDLKGRFAGSNKRYPGFFDPTEKEQEILSATPQDLILQIIQRVLG